MSSPVLDNFGPFSHKDPEILRHKTSYPHINHKAYLYYENKTCS